MAYTLAQLAKIETEPLRKGVIMNLLRDAPIFEKVPFENVSSLHSIAVRWRTLPSVAFRGIGGAYTEGTDGDTEQVEESVYGFGGELKFDRVFDKIKNTIVDLKVQQTEMKLKAMAYQFSDYFINGDLATDPLGFEGLKKRISNMPTRQKMYATAAAASTALIPTGSVAFARQFLGKWEQAWYKCNKGDVNGIFMNEGMYYGFANVLRYLGAAGGNLLDITKDSFDRPVLTYHGAPFFDMGTKKDQATEIITNTETAGDSGSDSTSVYFASFGTGDQQITGIQLSPLEAYDLNNGGEMETYPATQKRIDWWCGLAAFGSYGITRLWNISDPALWT
jgi:hypothetical protein